MAYIPSTFEIENLLTTKTRKGLKADFNCLGTSYKKGFFLKVYVPISFWTVDFVASYWQKIRKWSYSGIIIKTHWLILELGTPLLNYRYSDNLDQRCRLIDFQLLLNKRLSGYRYFGRWHFNQCGYQHSTFLKCLEKNFIMV